MSGPILLEVAHVEVPLMEWGMSGEEVLGGPGRATLIVQSRDNSWDPQAHWDVRISIRSNGWVLFRGEIITPHAVLPVGFPWTRWVLDCADYNDEIPQRKVGALDGQTWVDVDGFGSFVNVDPYANTLSDDRTTIQALFDHYFRVDGQAADTDAYVGTYLSNIDPPVYWTYTDLQAALEDLASLISVNVQDWLDPDLKFHHQAIPAWQDLAQEFVSSDPSFEAPLARMLPEFLVGTLGTAPVDISDVAGTPGAIGCRELSFTFDGSAMPEQVYVKGGTGYVYNNGIQQFTPTVGGDTALPPAGQYVLTFNAPTLVFSRHSTGYIAEPGTVFGSAGMQVYVNPVVVPIDPVHLTGGHFWEMKTGAMPGWLVSAHSNELGYGDITVTAVPTVIPPGPPPPPPAPTIGIGGSGWTGEATQDPNKRQAYFDAPVSVTAAQRDSIGGQIQYRGSRPTVRGSFKVGGVDPITKLPLAGADGWRVGQLVRIQDARLPAVLNGRYFVIQRVGATLIPGNDVREYTIDWGDGPVSRYSAQKRDRESNPPPVVGVLVTVEDVGPEPGTSQKVTGQLINPAGLPWPIPGKTVDWSLEVLDLNGNIIGGQGALSPIASITDQAGKAYTTLTAGDQLGLTYIVFANVAVV